MVYSNQKRENSVLISTANSLLNHQNHMIQLPINTKLYNELSLQAAALNFPSFNNHFFIHFHSICPPTCSLKHFSKSTNNKLLLSSEKKLGFGLWPPMHTTWPWKQKQQQLDNNEYRKMRPGKALSGKAIFVLCIASFLSGSLFTSRTWTHHKDNHNIPISTNPNHFTNFAEITSDRDHKRKLAEGESVNIMGEVTKTHQALQSLDKTISALEMELAVARTRKSSDGENTVELRASNHSLQKAFVVIGINTAFSSKKRRDSLRQTWMPTGDKLKKLEKEKGIVIRFVIGHSATPGGVLDKTIDAEEAEYQDFLRLNHVEGYHELSTKTRLYFSTAISIWDAQFYVKVDDDVHLNLGMLVNALARHRSKPRIYIGCMKSGPVLSQKGVKYHEPEYWKFGEEGNKYFRHATGQIYAISKDLAAYISINMPILHRYANEDVSLGAWFIGLEVEHVDDRSLCCGTPPDCEWKARAGNVCAASFDWSCSGICKSVERMKDVHSACGEGDAALWKLHI